MYLKGSIILILVLRVSSSPDNVTELKKVGEVRNVRQDLSPNDPNNNNDFGNQNLDSLTFSTPSGTGDPQSIDPTDQSQSQYGTQPGDPQPQVQNQIFNQQDASIPNNPDSVTITNQQEIYDGSQANFGQGGDHFQQQSGQDFPNNQVSYEATGGGQIIAQPGSVISPGNESPTVVSGGIATNSNGYYTGGNSVGLPVATVNGVGGYGGSVGFQGGNGISANQPEYYSHRPQGYQAYGVPSYAGGYTGGYIGAYRPLSRPSLYIHRPPSTFVVQRPQQTVIISRPRPQFQYQYQQNYPAQYQRPGVIYQNSQRPNVIIHHPPRPVTYYRPGQQQVYYRPPQLNYQSPNYAIGYTGYQRPNVQYSGGFNGQYFGECDIRFNPGSENPNYHGYGPPCEGGSGGHHGKGHDDSYYRPRPVGKGYKGGIGGGGGGKGSFFGNLGQKGPIFGGGGGKGSIFGGGKGSIFGNLFNKGGGGKYVDSYYRRPPPQTIYQ